MVLEHLFPENWLEKKSKYAFLLGALYSIVGIIFGYVLFPKDPALVAVAFTSLMLFPSLYKLFSIEERVEDKERRFSFRELYKDNRDFTKVYVFLFIGILIVYSLGAIFLDQMATNNLFRAQLGVMSEQSGKAVAGVSFSSSLFFDLLKNNVRVLIFCFLLSLFTGDGAIFLITWNASVWGTIFGDLARGAAGGIIGIHPFFLFVIIILIVFPHMMLEALSYILGAISGGVISKAIIQEKIGSSKFTEVIIYNLALLAVALIVLLLAVGVETFVLNNVDTYRYIITQSFIGGA